ncbi:DUF2182 domain-containing protein [Streptomyces sp. NBC_01214]|uniref:DUF2182 domain-containing protein n=1 Tax=Streptomyces sp. NBC_01214 TaxID=2903777 RepID=UPI0022532A10|nr:DUF2182 domain-containing protein [Streptomyces sp. NBC_01214]MCX4804189.1 DUF2182 domain-containing protein [Streptomyces sp. NBC_01214]
MTVQGAARVRSPRTAPVRRLLRRLLRPRVSLAFELASVAAWTALVALAVTGGSHGADGADGTLGTGAPHHHVSTTHAVHGVAGSGDLAMWALMSVAMMLPAAVPALEHVGTNSLRRRRQRAMATCAAVYLAVWIGYGALLLGPAALWARLPDDVALACALALAAAWQLTVHKRRALRDCHRSSPLPPTGWRAVAGAARFGLRQGGACLRSCWALMLVMAVASGRGGMLAWMAVLTGIVMTERLARKPRRPTRLAAAALAAASLAVALPAAGRWY